MFTAASATATTVSSSSSSSKDSVNRQFGQSATQQSHNHLSIPMQPLKSLTAVSRSASGSLAGSNPANSAPSNPSSSSKAAPFSSSQAYNDSYSANTSEFYIPLSSTYENFNQNQESTSSSASNPHSHSHYPSSAVSAGLYQSYSSYQQHQQQSQNQNYMYQYQQQFQQYNNWSSSSNAANTAGGGGNTPTTTINNNGQASARYQFLNKPQTSSSSSSSSSSRMEFGGGGLTGSAISAAAVGGSRSNLSSTGGNPTTSTSTAVSATASGVGVASGLSSISFDYTGHGTSHAPRQASPVSNNSGGGGHLSMYAGNGSFNTHLFTGNSGGGNGTAAANYSGGYMGNVPSRPQSASSFLSLENHFASTSFFGVGVGNGGQGGGGHNPNTSLISSIISPTTSFNSADDGGHMTSMSGHGYDSSFMDHHQQQQQLQQHHHMLLQPQHRPSTPPDSSVSFEANSSSVTSTSLFAGGGVVLQNGGSMVTGGGNGGGGMGDNASIGGGGAGGVGASSGGYSNDRPEAMRTLYFGNLPPDLPISVFLNHVRGGLLEECKYLTSKNCVFVTFLEASVAAAVYLEYQQHPFTIDGYECRVGWGKPSTLHLHIRNQVLRGATRNVFLGNLDTDVFGEKELEEEFSGWGMVDCVRVIPEKRIGFVHLCSVGAAVKAVAALGHECGVEGSKWWACRVYYGRDRCCTQGPPTATSAVAYEGEIGNGMMPEENRTVYIGGIHTDVTTKDLCDVIRGGLLQQVKYFPEKNICFATFVSPISAAAFYNSATTHGLVLRSKRMKIGWGKPSMLPLSIANAVDKGASRNVYIGSIDMEGYEGGEAEVKELLYNNFEVFGEIELVNIVVEKRIGFVCFTDIVSAIKAVEAMRGDNAKLNGAQRRENCLFRRVNFGKDRCAGPFRSPKNSVSPPSSPE